MAEVYDLMVTFVQAAEWNRSVMRRQLAESSCPARRYVVTAETFPADDQVDDDGGVLVAQFDAGSPASDALSEVIERARGLMTAKLGKRWEAGDLDVLVIGRVPECEAMRSVG